MPLKYVKQIYDNVHGYIGITAQELEIIDTPLFQRLREIKQLGPAYLVFPGATHSRLAHCIGTMFMIDQFAKNSVRYTEVSDDELEKLRLAALLHDIGHYPFSHTLEHAIRHELNGADHVTFGVSIIKRFLQEKIENYRVDEIASLIEGDRKNEFSILLSSAIDADKSDYMLRDSYNTGVLYGNMNMSSLMRIMSFEKDKIVFDKDASPVENFLLGRYHLYRVVIHHKVVVAISLALQRIYYLLVEEGFLRNPTELLKTQNEEDITSYTDDAVHYAMHEYLAKGKNGTLRELIMQYLRRESPELSYAYVTTNPGPGRNDKRKARIDLLENDIDARKSIAKKAGINENWIFPVTLRSLGLVDEETKIFIRRGSSIVPIIDSDALVLRMIGSKTLYDARLYTKKGHGKELRHIFLEEVGKKVQ